MIEPYQWLRANAALLGLDEAVIGPCSADLTLGETIRAYHGNGECIMRLGQGVPVVFQPGWFYLVATQETIHMPDTHCGFVHMRSSLARQGLGHKMAGLIDPGFCGQITLELETALHLTIPVGARIVQITFHRLSEATQHPYRGRYQGQTGPTRADGPPS
jgi:dCTP deaminase